MGALLAQVHSACADLGAAGSCCVLAIQSNILLILCWELQLLLVVQLLLEKLVVLKRGVAWAQGACRQLKGSRLAIPCRHHSERHDFKLLVLLAVLLVSSPSTLALRTWNAPQGSSSVYPLTRFLLKSLRTPVLMLPCVAPCSW